MVHMSESFTDVSGWSSTGAPDYWAPIIFRANDDRCRDRPSRGDAVAGQRAATSLFTHPRSPAEHPSLAPGIRVALNVLLPGERTAAVRHNSTMVGFARCVAAAAS